MPQALPVPQTDALTVSDHPSLIFRVGRGIRVGKLWCQTGGVARAWCGGDGTQENVLSLTLAGLWERADWRPEWGILPHVKTTSRPTELDGKSKITKWAG